MVPLPTPARCATSSSRAAANPRAENSSSAAARMASRRNALLSARLALMPGDWDLRAGALTAAPSARAPRPFGARPLIVGCLLEAMDCFLLAIKSYLTDQSVII